MANWLLLFQVSWIRHREIPDGTRFRTLADFNNEFADAPVSEDTRTCM